LRTAKHADWCILEAGWSPELPHQSLSLSRYRVSSQSTPHISTISASKTILHHKTTPSLQASQIATSHLLRKIYNYITSPHWPPYPVSQLNVKATTLRHINHGFANKSQHPKTKAKSSRSLRDPSNTTAELLTTTFDATNAVPSLVLNRRGGEAKWRKPPNESILQFSGTPSRGCGGCGEVRLEWNEWTEGITSITFR